MCGFRNSVVYKRLVGQCSLAHKKENQRPNARPVAFKPSLLPDMRGVAKRMVGNSFSPSPRSYIGGREAMDFSNVYLVRRKEDIVLLANLIPT